MEITFLWKFIIDTSLLHFVIMNKYIKQYDETTKNMFL